ncbi:MAG: metal-dependent hydrolase [Porticoccaceae bacterium]|nr:metal-dependent hydrolase [Porticoccaceae bacterium]
MTALRSPSRTPDDISISARKVNFDLKQALATDWADNDPFVTAIFNAMSISFPSGEKNFIDSVRTYEKQINDEKLLKDIKGFYKQEGIHSREHRKYNKTLCEQRGYNLQELEGVYLRRIKTAKSNPRVTNKVLLASTVAVEHFTASFGETFLEGRILKNVEGPIGDLWRWHALEELEHKSVAFDVYSQIGGSYKLRKTIMRIAMVTLLKDSLTVALKMLRHDKQLWKWHTFKSLTKLLFFKDGFVRLHATAYKDFFREDFHPWDSDNRALLVYWQQKLEPIMAAA